MKTNKPKVTGIGLRNLILLVLLMTVFNTVMVGFLFWIAKDFPVVQKIERVEVKHSDFLTDYGINQRIRELIKEGKEESIYKFYDQMTENRSVTYALVSAAQMYSIPTHYLFALAWVESRFIYTASNDKLNKDGSVDYGLLQLNSNTFKQYKKETLLDLNNNVRIGGEFIMRQYQKYGNWYEVMMSYNGGNTELVKNPTVNYMVAVMDYAKDLDIRFSKVF